MAGANASKALGSKGRSDQHNIPPEEVSIVYDSKHPLYKEGMFLPVDIDIQDLPEKKHPCYDAEGAYLPFEESTVRLFMMIGAPDTAIGIRRNGIGTKGPRKGMPIIECVFGRQRVKNCREANKRLAKDGKETINVPCVVKRGDDAKIVGMWISENAHRRDTSPMATARNIQQFISYGKDEDEAAIFFKVTKQTIKAQLTLLDLAPVVQHAVENGKLGATLASQQFSRIPREEQPAKLAELLAAGGGVAKGAAAKEKARALRGVGPTVKAPRPRAGREIAKAIKKITKDEPTGHAVAAAVLKWVLQRENCLTSHPALEKILDPEPAS